MASDFSIQIERWERPIHGSPEVANTAAEISISVDGWIATQADDRWARSVRNEVLLSAYPLALWLAASWWRLRWESMPQGRYEKQTSWGMAHKLAAAGFGFLWPNLTFIADGEGIDVFCLAGRGDTREPIRYLTEFQATVPARTFEHAVDAFLSTVLARLDSMDQESDLKVLWGYVLEDRADPQKAYWRELEARLGFDIGEAPDGVIGKLLDIVSRAGDSAVREVASGIADGDPLGTVGKVLEAADTSGVVGQIEAPPSVLGESTKIALQQQAPWERGSRLARFAREGWGLNGNPVPSKHLAEMLAVPPSTLTETPASLPRDIPMGLSIRDNESDRLKFLFRKRNHAGRRFEAARFLADWLFEHQTDLWFPATDAHTARQKAQRAFAAEFLCPIDSLTEFLGDDFGDEAIEEASARFQVSSYVIMHHLVNHYLLDRASSWWTERPLP
jgi:hypothetical protein